MMKQPTTLSPSQTDLPAVVARPQQAVAIEYDPETGAPRVTARGQGVIAEQIIQRAQEHGIPIREDVPLTQLLNTLELGQEIPPELYLAVAEIISWVYRIEKRSLKVDSNPRAKLDTRTDTNTL